MYTNVSSIRMCVSHVALTLGIGIAWVSLGLAADAPAPVASQKADAATAEYLKNLDPARQDFQKRLDQIRHDYEIKALGMRKVYIAHLKTAGTQETRDGNKAAAESIKKMIAQLEGERSLDWPKDIFPKDPAASEAGAAGISTTVTIRNMDELRKWFDVPGSVGIVNGAFNMVNTGIKSKFTLSGDFRITMTGHGGPGTHRGNWPLQDMDVKACGCEIRQPFGTFKDSQTGKWPETCILERKGAALQITSESGHLFLTRGIPDDQQKIPTALEIADRGTDFGSAILFIKIEGVMQMNAAPPPAK